MKQQSSKHMFYDHPLTAKGEMALIQLEKVGMSIMGYQWLQIGHFLDSTP
jgi:hypothetical protein